MQISDNSKPGENQGRKATGLKHYARTAGLPKRKQEWTVCFGTQFFFCGDEIMGGKNMKKVLALLTIAALLASMSLSALAVSDNAGNGGGNSQKDSTQKEFKQELTEQMKEVSRLKKELATEKEDLEAQYEELLADGDTEGAEALAAQIEELEAQLKELEEQKKQLIQERYMVVKTIYSEEELQQFNSAAELIEQMYADAYTLEAGSIIVKNNIIKLETPAYIKNSRTLIPVRAISEGLGAEVTWDAETLTVTVSKDGTEVVITLNDTTVTVDGAETELEVPAELSCGRTYVPLRFLAEVFGLDVDWDGDTEVIDIEESAADDGSSDDGTTGDDATDDGVNDDGTTGEESAA
jgi:polyhydroxyalkanoate synthesis regulator phasin